VDFFTRQKVPKADLAEIYEVLASNLAEEALKEKAYVIGRPDALGCMCCPSYHAITIDVVSPSGPEGDVRFYFKDVVEHLGVLLGVIEKEFESTCAHLYH
jgi:hypothetical protein